MNKKVLLSVIVIARNEESRIARCLASASWADEKIVIDNGSTDETSREAKKCGAAVFEEKNHDFSKIRELGAKRAAGEWLLYIDADETVTPGLRDEILAVIGSKTATNAFFVPRQNYYLGELWPTQDGMVRLIRKNALVKWEGALHEHAVVKGETGTLRNYFIHSTHRTLEEMVQKTNEWSVVEAKLRFEHHHPSISWWRLLRVMLTAFMHSYITEGGWKIGGVGWIESVYQAFSMFITYAKLWEMQQNNKVTK
jgi:glycosyltransferase involved in cell wall biosynthesis